MTVKEAAESLGVTPSTIRNQIEKGVLRARKIGRDWSITPGGVERYRRDHRGKRERPNLHTPATDALRLMALRRPKTKAKMRAAKLGRTLTPEHIDKVRAALSRRVIRPETRQKHRARQLGIPKSAEHRAALRLASQRPEVRSRRSAAQVALYLSGRKPYSKLEQAAAELLLPLGFARFPSYDGHAFDFGRGDVVVEVNGCGIHRHRDEAPCSWSPLGPRGRNDRYRQVARDRTLTLIELWACQRKHWSDLVTHP